MIDPLSPDWRKRMDALQGDMEKRRKAREVVRATDILCDHCGKSTFVVESPGSETEEWLRCPNCGQYYYFIGRMTCGDVLTRFEGREDFLARCRRELGQ